MSDSAGTPAPGHHALITTLARIILTLSAIVIALTADTWYLAIVPLLILAASGGFTSMSGRSRENRGQHA